VARTRNKEGYTERGRILPYETLRIRLRYTPYTRAENSYETPYTTVVNYGKNKKKKRKILRIGYTPFKIAVQNRKKLKKGKKDFTDTIHPLQDSRN